MGQSKRLKLGILFNVSRSWLGGVYYIVNLVKALDFLDESVKPDVVVFYSKELKEFTVEMTYSRLQLVPWKIDPPLSGYLRSWITRRNTFSNEIVTRYKLDGIYPEWNQPVPVGRGYDRPVKSVSWFADLQHRYYPEFFTRRQLLLREFRLRQMLWHTDDLIVSSNSAEKDFRKFYRIRDDLAIHVLNFVSIIDDFDWNDSVELRHRYGIPDQYFMVSNQFHRHKNHIVLLRALAELKRRGAAVHMVITGRMPDDTGSDYITSIRTLIDRHDLGTHVHFLGVIPRQDQLRLMKGASAVIQPSLFEGWSTVIEDAKSLQVPVIASDLEVHMEQLGSAGIYFPPHDEHRLAEILGAWQPGGETQLYRNYEDRVRDFSESFIQIFQQVEPLHYTPIKSGSGKPKNNNNIQVMNSG